MSTSKKTTTSKTEPHADDLKSGQDAFFASSAIQQLRAFDKIAHDPMFHFIDSHPMHVLITSKVSDCDILDALSNLNPDHSDNRVFIRSHAPFFEGATPLHIAAQTARLDIIKALLEAGAKPDLHELDDAGHTPLEFLDRTLHELRERRPDTFGGFAKHVTQSKAFLLEALGRSVPSIEQLKWGCSCGACLEGWLSPVVRARLMTVCVRAEKALVNAVLSLEKSREEAGDSLVAPDIRIYDGFDARLPDSLEFIPKPFRTQNLSEGFLRGYAFMFTCAETILRAGYIPHPSALDEVADMNVRSTPAYQLILLCYQVQGGTAEHALNAALTMVEEMGTDTAQTKQELADELPSISDALSCANDTEFAAIRRNLDMPACLDGRFGAPEVSLVLEPQVITGVPAEPLRLDYKSQGLTRPV
ncbi:hypothetical protein PENSPDRAFT_755169 [Peniophora sp. CONT]|nr:hypothetical protein PENSPDRAFT_755169 [Peniophora sp. CONT]